ncbi:MAG: nucleotidyltransferase domain-containing protein [Elusimicrobiota bacterium]
MKNNHLFSIFKFTNAQKVLSFLADNVGKEFVGSEIQKATGISKAGVYLALAELVKCELVVKVKKGGLLLFNANYQSPFVKQFKMLLNVIQLKPVLDSIRDLSTKIVLYGSASRGEDSPDSDIDLFIVSKDTKITQEKLFKVKFNRKIQSVIKVPSEIPEFKAKEKVFFDEVSRGITLWEMKE